MLIELEALRAQPWALCRTTAFALSETNEWLVVNWLTHFY